MLSAGCCVQVTCSLQQVGRAWNLPQSACVQSSWELLQSTRVQSSQLQSTPGLLGVLVVFVCAVSAVRLLRQPQASVHSRH